MKFLYSFEGELAVKYESSVNNSEEIPVRGSEDILLLVNLIGVDSQLSVLFKGDGVWVLFERFSSGNDSSFSGVSRCFCSSSVSSA